MKHLRTISVVMVLALCFGAAQSVDAKKKKTRKRVNKTEKSQTVKPEEKVVQDMVPPKAVEEKKVEPKQDASPKPQKEEVFMSAAHMPEFPGGNAALMTFMSQNILYPQVAQDNGIQGKVVVQFVVEKDGSVGEVKIVRGVDKSLDKEAVRLCKSLPKFKPGLNAEGKPVRVWYTMPVNFRLQGTD